jgi:hypothetical protein
MSAKRYPPLLCWLESEGPIAAAPELLVAFAGAVDCGVTVGWVCGVLVDCCVLVTAVVCELVEVCEPVVCELVAVWVPAVVAVVAPDVDAVAAVDDAPVLVVVVAAGGGGAPGVGGSVDVPGPVIIAPFLAGSITNAEESGAWMFATAPVTLSFEEAFR